MQMLPSILKVNGYSCQSPIFKRNLISRFQGLDVHGLLLNWSTADLTKVQALSLLFNSVPLCKISIELRRLIFGPHIPLPDLSLPLTSGFTLLPRRAMSSDSE